MAREKAPSDGTDKGQRRVYVLPNELVERIADYQKQSGFASEVEAVRRLLDNALRSRDNVFLIANRVYRQRDQGKPLPDAIRDVLWGHPLLDRMFIEGGTIPVFTLKDGTTLRFEDDGQATLLDIKNRPFHFTGSKPSWASSSHQDDDIPF